MVRPLLALLLGSMVLSTARAEEPPSLELLEFLFEWQDETGEFVDPFSLPDNTDEQTPGKESADVEK